jgi:hypothetical protein
LGTFWLKIEQFWPFEEISIFSNGGHLGYKNCVSKALFYQTRNSDIHYGQLLLSCFILILTFGNFQIQEKEFYDR